MTISKNIAESLTRSSWIRKMFEQGTQLKAKYGAERVYDFSIGNPDLESPSEFNRALVREASRSGPFVHGYMPNAGYPETRKVIAELLTEENGFTFQNDHIIMTVGAAGAMNVILKALLNPGEEVVVIAPYFVEYQFYIDNHGGEKVIAQSTDKLLPDLEDLAAKLGPQTKAVIINTPNNPSGRVYPYATLEQIGTLLKEKSNRLGRPIYLISDEPYKKIIYDKAVHYSPFRFYDNSCVLTSFSKDLSLAGERIGYLAINPRCHQAGQLIKATNFTNRTLGYVNAPALMQRTVKHALTARVDVEKYKKRRDILYQGLSEIGYEVIKPDGTFYMFPCSPIDDDVAFVKGLQDELILTTPGSGFQCPGHFRISYCMPGAKIEQAIPGFKRAYQAFQDRTS